MDNGEQHQDTLTPLHAGEEDNVKRPDAKVNLSNDGLRQYHGFLNEIKPVTQKDRTLYFARIGFFNGPPEEDNEKGRSRKIVNVEVLIGNGLILWAKSLLSSESSELPSGYNKLLHRFSIRYLDFTPVIHKGSAYLNNTGVLEGFELGHNL